MGFDYEHSQLPARYNAARALRPQTLRQWMDAIVQLVGGATIHLALDLGCGTGRFTSALQQAFSSDVIGLDPSRKMLAQAMPQPCVRYVVGRAEAIPISDEVIDLTFISMVWHHFHDKVRAGREVHRTLKPGGFLCIRTSTIETLDSYLYLRFFPTALVINEQTLPSRAQLNHWATSSGFRLRQRSEIRQQVNASLPEYVARIEQRGLSDLARISDGEFADGLRELRAYCDQQPGARGPVFETLEFFAFTRE
jgi:ubiquinone/menaquinone biosynthesis C-methylase UbiE